MKMNLKLALWFVGSGFMLLPHGKLWAVAVIQIKRFARSRWWAKAPFLPLPSSAYWQFRMESIYGDGTKLPSRKDLIEYLEWCLEIR